MKADNLTKVSRIEIHKPASVCKYSLVPKKSHATLVPHITLMRPNASVHPWLFLGSICNFGEKIGDDLFLLEMALLCGQPVQP